MTMTIVGVFFHEVFNVWAFIICFFLIRNRAGGFHFNSFWKCYLGSVGLEFLGIYLVKQLNDNTCVFECISIGMMVILSGIMLVLGIIAGQHTVGRRKF